MTESRSPPISNCPPSRFVKYVDALTRSGLVPVSSQRCATGLLNMKRHKFVPLVPLCAIPSAARYLEGKR